MRRLVLLCCLPLLAAGLSHSYRERRILELNRALHESNVQDPLAPYYRAVCDARMGREAAAIEGIRKYIAAKPAAAEARRANEELVGALVRLGRYKEAAETWADVVRLTDSSDSRRADAENSRAICVVLSNVPPQTAEIAPDRPLTATRNGLGSWDVPVEVNGRQAKWIFDTGGNFSTVSASEAVRLGLEVRDTSSYVSGSTGKKNTLRLAVAPSLRIGGATVRNVVFLVVDDKAIYIEPLKTQINGILGLPATRALGTVGISAAGAMRIGQHLKAPGGDPNLFFEDLELMAGIRHRGRDLQLFLDTGANGSVLFRAALTGEETAGLQQGKRRTAGAGGTAEAKVATFPSFDFDVLDMRVSLAKIPLMLDPPEEAQRHRDGVMGMDALARGFTLDFESMQLRLD
jgi:predicted aspartyl protease